jgi:hypothetical protein
MIDRPGPGRNRDHSGGGGSASSDVSAVTALFIGVRHGSAGCLVLAPEALSSEGCVVKVVAL